MWSGFVSRSNLLCTILVCMGVYGLALYARLNLLPGALALQDTVGPFWAALRLDGRAHAEPYSAAMLIPYWVILHTVESLWSAMNGLAILHALIAPLAAWWSVRHFDAHWVTAGLIGALVGLDPGLLDTFQSGAEGYFAALLVQQCFGFPPLEGRLQTELRQDRRAIDS